MDVKWLQEFAALSQEKRRLTVALEAIKPQWRHYTERFLELCIELNTTKIPVQEETLFLTGRTTVGPGPSGHEGVKKALRELGLEILIEERVNYDTLGAWITERRKAEQPIPQTLLDVVTVHELTWVQGTPRTRAMRRAQHVVPTPDAHASAALTPEDDDVA